MLFLHVRCLSLGSLWKRRGLPSRMMNAKSHAKSHFPNGMELPSPVVQMRTSALYCRVLRVRVGFWGNARARAGHLL